jgi:hypothetical protein
MIKVTREQKGDQVSAWIEGIISEQANLPQALGQLPRELHLYCGGIPRITSFGVKQWIEFFTKATKLGTRVTFHECSPAVINQANMITNFLCGGRVQSLFLPFACLKCKREMIELFELKDLLVPGYTPNPISCSCGGKAVLDVTLGSYLKFAGVR